MESNTRKPKRTKKQWALFFAGLIAFCTGSCILGYYGIRKIRRELRKQKLMRENAVIEIPSLRIKAPVLEGTDKATLAQAAGHFPETGVPGKGNCCIAAHSSVIYKEYFNNLKNAEKGTEIFLTDRDKQRFCYTVAEMNIVNPDAVYILEDQGDDRLTLVTCTDDGTQRLVVTAFLQTTDRTSTAEDTGAD